MNKSFHVTLITETYAPEINGVANTLSRLCDGLRLRGHRVEVVRPRQSEDESHACGDDLMLCRGWPIPGYPGLQWGQLSMHKLLRRWQRNRPDVLYIATEGPLGLAALRAARRLRIAIVSGFHTHFQQYMEQYGLGLMTRLLTSYLRWFHNRSNSTLVPSVSQKTELARRGFERLELLARGVDCQLFHPSRRSSVLREQWGLGPCDTAVLHVGRLAPEKNLGLLKTTFDTLTAAYPRKRLKLVIVGDGPVQATLQRQLPDAFFCGTQRGEALAAHYASGDLFLFPSMTETFGNVVLEALASGLGVVAYDEAAASQHIRHGHNGVVAMPGDEEGFIDAARWMLEDDETLRRVRLNARQHAGHQGWAQVIDAFERHLRDASEPRESIMSVTPW
ncbi:MULTISPECIES: glycosyltransferase family 4 protein [unclassified Pseudomonas]|uniref:glycosyltransferase family 4 protein n=1 Tax=unclassified Pseudomonas TaxID=196821 RepID=UPI0025EF096C|nr:MULTISPECIES: glycosyltransferase family 1 protein [unclassified Pseudomonas]